MKSSTYEMEISKADGKMFIVAANKSKHSEHYIIELESEKGEEILAEFNNNFETISSNLKVISRRLVLLNPKVAEAQRLRGRTSSVKQRRISKVSRLSMSNYPDIIILKM